jgi:hypothetical protein
MLFDGGQRKLHIRHVRRAQHGVRLQFLHRQERLRTHLEFGTGPVGFDSHVAAGRRHQQINVESRFRQSVRRRDNNWQCQTKADD